MACILHVQSLNWQSGELKHVSGTVFRQINAPGVEADNEPNDLSDLNEIHNLNP